MTHDEAQTRVNAILSRPDSRAGQIVELVVGTLIIVICGLYVWEMMPIDDRLRDKVYFAEQVITVIFLIEYLARFWASRFNLRALIKPVAIIDLLAILPLFFNAPHLQAVRVLRLLRVLRLVRLLQDRRFFFGEVTDSHLLVARILLTVFSIVFITGGVVYDLEKTTNGAFTSLFDGFYFALVTLTTVGFGDITPVTWEAKAVTMVMILTGLTVIPFQLTKLARHIVAESHHKATTCEACGLQYHDYDASHCKACGSLIYQEYDGA